MKNFLLILALIPGLFLAEGLAREPEELIVFTSPTCKECMEIKEEVLPLVEKEFSGRIRVRTLDISQIENYKLLLELKERYASSAENILPVFYFKGRFLNGRGGIEKRLWAFLNESMDAPAPAAPSGPGAGSDLAAYFNTFKPLAVAGAGLVDGINPCAF
ncbi:MAG: hypothetical protein PHE18_08965, partial [Candidatus Omnitrophica bacterium]|nr:hypothetical protein [Candidatus Omnitrophota bacterium]